MRLAPIGAFGAMAFTIGRYGVASLGPLAKLIATFWITCILFVLIVLGAVALLAGFNIIKFLLYIKEEILLVLAVSSSEPALPTLMEKMEKLGCSRALVGLVVPTGYTFNTDGTSIYMTLAALFVAQATNTHLTLSQQLTIFAVAVLTSKGASGVQGAAFIALVGTMMVIPTIPVAGMAIDPGDRPLYEHVPRAHQYGGQRRRDGGGGALGKRAGQQDIAGAARLIEAGPTLARPNASRPNPPAPVDAWLWDLRRWMPDCGPCPPPFHALSSRPFDTAAKLPAGP